MTKKPQLFSDVKEERELMEGLRNRKPASRLKLAFWTLVFAALLGVIFASLQQLCLSLNDEIWFAFAFWAGVWLVLGFVVVASIVTLTGQVLRKLQPGKKP